MKPGVCVVFFEVAEADDCIKWGGGGHEVRHSTIKTDCVGGKSPWLDEKSQSRGGGGGLISQAQGGILLARVYGK